MSGIDLEKKAENYRKLTEKALKKARISVPINSSLFIQAKDFKEMAENYLKDGIHFQEKKEFAVALASFSYAHAWLDAGARLGLFDVKNDYKLFTLFK